MLVEVDVRGARAIQHALPDAYVVFVRPPSRAVQWQRLRARDPAGSDAALTRRLDEADAEEAQADAFDAVVVNDDLERAVDEVQTLLARRRAAAPG